MLRGRNLKQACKPGSSSMPSASLRFDFSGYFKAFIPQARWFIIIETLYNSLFLQSALQSFFSPHCVPCLPSLATIIGFGGRRHFLSLGKEDAVSDMRHLLRFYLYFSFAFCLLISFPVASYHLPFLCSHSDLHPHIHFPPLSSNPTQLILVPHL